MGAVKLTKTDISRKIKYSGPKVSKGRSESPLVGRWGKAPYSKMLRYLLFEMFGLSLTALFYCGQGVPKEDAVEQSDIEGEKFSDSVTFSALLAV